jgi:hypothetical protein
MSRRKAPLIPDDLLERLGNNACLYLMGPTSPSSRTSHNLHRVG